MIPPQEAVRLVLKGKAPDGLETSQLDLSRSAVTRLPAGLRVTRLVLDGCAGLVELPADLRCYHLQANGTPLRSLPADLRVEFKVQLRDCTALEALPAGFKVNSLDLRGCTGLRSLPEGLAACFLDLAGCTALERFPEQAVVSLGRLNVRGCAGLATLPPWLGALSQLDVSGCPRLTALPDSLHVSGWIDLAGTAIRELPRGCRRAALRWRGVPVDDRIAFHPETIAAAEVLAERNAERRRVLLERCGYERFVREASAKTLDEDRDPGGERRLLRVPLEGDEDLVCVSVRCPSTGRTYMIRVPPKTRSCREAVAWIAGFDDPAGYDPVVET